MIAGVFDRSGIRRNATTLALAIAVAAATLGIGAAVGSAASGGVGVGDGPELEDVTCVDRCLDVRTVTETGKVELSGENLSEVTSVRFPSSDGRVAVKPRQAEDDMLTAVVPRGARTGKPSVVDEFGGKSASPVTLEVEPEDAIEEAGEFSVTKAKASPSKSFFSGKRNSSVEYLFESDGNSDVRIDVLNTKTGDIVDSIIERRQKPFTNHSVEWDGLADKRVAPIGKYRFQVSSVSGGPGARAGFKYYDHIFPLRGKHDYGDGLGAGRNHQGQDVFAKCGTKLVAARGGRIQTKAYHSAAGYYVVIDGRKTGRDYVYMHMAKKGLPKEGSRVRTGELIGYQSDTGNASGCHLHFELWSAPGWYEGGRPLDPTRAMKKWDKWS